MRTRESATTSYPMNSLMYNAIQTLYPKYVARVTRSATLGRYASNIRSLATRCHADKDARVSTVDVTALCNVAKAAFDDPQQGREFVKGACKKILHHVVDGQTVLARVEAEFRK